MQFVFFYPTDIQKRFWETNQFCQKSGNDANSRRRVMFFVIHLLMYKYESFKASKKK